MIIDLNKEKEETFELDFTNQNDRFRIKLHQCVYLDSLEDYRGIDLGIDYIRGTFVPNTFQETLMLPTNRPVFGYRADHAAQASKIYDANGWAADTVLIYMYDEHKQLYIEIHDANPGNYGAAMRSIRCGSWGYVSTGTTTL